MENSQALVEQNLMNNPQMQQKRVVSQSMQYTRQKSQASDS